MNLNNELATLISWAIYLQLFLGIGIIAGKDLELIILRFRLRKRLLVRKKAMEPAKGIIRHLNDLLIGFWGGRLNGHRFILLTGSFSILIFVAGHRNLDLVQTIFATLSCAAMPYLILRIRHENVKRKGSHEGEEFINNFVSQYRLSGFNILDTIEQLVNHYPETFILNKFITRLLMALRTTNDSEKIRIACHQFSTSIGTNWAGMLAYNIGLATETGINISQAAEDILIQMREARLLLEERKRLNGEAVRMVLYLIPGLFVGTVFLSVKAMGMGWKDYVNNQFFTQEGFLLLLTTFLLLMFNIALVEGINNKQFDF